MLEEFQILAADIQSPLILASSRCLEILSQQGDLSDAFVNSLHYFDAYLVITNITSIKQAEIDVINGFRGFLTVEFDLDPAYEISIFESAIRLLVRIKIIAQSVIPSVEEFDDLFYSKCYTIKNPSAQAKELYESYFITSEQEVLSVDLTYASGICELYSREKLRVMFRPYIRRRSTYEAQTDVALIMSILGGIITRWPDILVTRSGLNESESANFFNDVLIESNRQAWIAGLSATEVGLNRQFLLRVILGFFVPNGLMFNLDYHSLV